MNLCGDCIYKKRVSGSAHIACSNPPATHFLIGSGGEERYEQAATMAKESQAVVRCIWPGSGMFPGGQLFGFDSNTVFGCANHTERMP